MLSALLMLRRVSKAFRYAVREDEFLNVFGAGVLLVVIGTVTYSLGAGWNVVDSLYLAVATPTTTSVSDPDLVLRDGWLKLSTVLYCSSASGSSLRSCVASARRSWPYGSRSAPGKRPSARGRRLPERGNERRFRPGGGGACQDGGVQSAKRRAEQELVGVDGALQGDGLLAGGVAGGRIGQQSRANGSGEEAAVEGRSDERPALTDPEVRVSGLEDFAVEVDEQGDGPEPALELDEEAAVEPLVSAEAAGEEGGGEAEGLGGPLRCRKRVQLELRARVGSDNDAQPRPPL